MEQLEPSKYVVESLQVETSEPIYLDLLKSPAKKEIIPT